jgi:hypothetical protein
MARGYRAEAWAGIAFAPLAVVSLLLPGELPKADATAAEVAAFVADEHRALLASSVIWFVAAVFLFWFLAGFSRWAALDPDASRYADHIRIGGIVGILVITLPFCATNGAAFSVAQHGADPSIVRAMYDLNAALFAMSGVGFAVLFAGAAGAIFRSTSFPRWVGWLAVVAGAVQFLYAAQLIVTSGPLATGGALGYVEPVFSTGWFVAASVYLLRVPSPDRPTLEP